MTTQDRGEWIDDPARPGWQFFTGDGELLRCRVCGYHTSVTLLTHILVPEVLHLPGCCYGRPADPLDP